MDLIRRGLRLEPRTARVPRSRKKSDVAESPEWGAEHTADPAVASHSRDVRARLQCKIHVVRDSPARKTRPLAERRPRRGASRELHREVGESAPFEAGERRSTHGRECAFRGRRGLGTCVLSRRRIRHPPARSHPCKKTKDAHATRRLHK